MTMNAHVAAAQAAIEHHRTVAGNGTAVDTPCEMVATTPRKD